MNEDCAQQGSVMIPQQALQGAYLNRLVAAVSDHDIVPARGRVHPPRVRLDPVVQRPIPLHHEAVLLRRSHLRCHKSGLETNTVCVMLATLPSLQFRDTFVSLASQRSTSFFG